MMSYGVLFLPASGFALAQTPVSNQVGATSMTATLGSAPSSGDLVIAVVGCFANTPTVSSSGATWTKAVGNTGGAADGCDIWWSTTVTTATITVTAASAANMGIDLFHFTGNAASPVDVTSVASAASPGSVTPTASNELVIAGVETNTGAGGTTTGTPSGYTAEADHTLNNIHYRAAYQIQTTATATNPTWTASGSPTWATAVAAFKHA